MTELEKAIERTRKALTDVNRLAIDKGVSRFLINEAYADNELILAAAESWAALVLRPLSRHPEREGDYFGYSLNMHGELKHKTVLTRENGSWWSYVDAHDDAKLSEHDSAFVWLDGALPSVPSSRRTVGGTTLAADELLGRKGSEVGR